jgi:hypothetical protein
VLTDADRARMRADLTEIRNDRAVNITIRRNGVTLAAQTVRIARSGQGRSLVSDSDGLQAAVGMVTLLGDPALNIQPGDKFTVAAVLYEVLAVHPHRDAAIMAEARMVQ